MEQEGTTLPDDVVLLSHGCGEYHPEVPTADNLDEPRNRRVEVFLFETKTAVPSPQPQCPASGCPEYPEWVARTQETIDLNRPSRRLSGDLQWLVTDSNKIVRDGGGTVPLLLRGVNRSGWSTRR